MSFLRASCARRAALLLCLLSASGAAFAAMTGIDSGSQTAQRLAEDPRYELMNSPEPRRGNLPIYVGSGSNCQYADLQAAIDAAPDGGELRLQNETFSGNFGISNKSLSLIGGFENCTATEPGFTSTLDGTDNGGNVVLDIYDNGDTGGSWLVELANLNITNGAESGPFERGGGIHVEDDFWVSLTDVTVSNNTAETDGGGIQITGDSGTALWIYGSTLIQGNSAGDGGGIACLAPQDQLAVIIDSGLIFDNSASRGGGIYAENCLVATHAGGVLQGIVGNQASSNGGGIAGLAGSEIVLNGASPGYLVDGNPDAAAVVASNSADGSGGGVWVVGGSSFESLDGRITGNSAVRGGGVSVDADSSFTMGRTDGNGCSEFLAGDSLAPCSSLSDNSADLVGGGFATGGTSSASATMNQTFISGNTAGLNAAVAEVTLGQVTMEGNVISSHDGDNQLIRQFGNTTLEIAWSTFADNTPSSGSPPVIEVHGASSSAATTELFANVFWNPGRDVYMLDTSAGSLTNLSAGCIVANETGSLPAAPDIIDQDPLFIDFANGDYHIQEQSPAVDLCNDSNAPLHPDMDGQGRGVEATSAATPYDAGADEWLPALIFRDRFESN